ncbi:hypothetical protein [Hyphomonas sp. GM-8P]|uniref:hypothetical protein n=1 Tax=Hyphomonas sp. GM-8P TaxID=1280945 RepID=UPI000DBF497D|nr:hypothetical protein [Hyphomonas sp. GM-8P]RAN39782.1 hypothetical protein HY26_14715 [Hyphomonas sp. GM-8P]
MGKTGATPNDKVYPRHFLKMRWKFPLASQPTQAAIIAFSKRLYRSSGVARSPIFMRREPVLDSRFLARSNSPVRLKPRHLEDLAEVVEYAAWLVGRQHVQNAFSREYEDGETYSVRLLLALLSDIDAVEERRRTSALSKSEAFAVANHAAVHPGKPTLASKVLWMEVLSALYWLSLTEKKATAQNWLRALLIKQGFDKASPRSMDKWLECLAGDFYSDTRAPADLQNVKYQKLSEVPEQVRFTPALAGYCAYCQFVWFRGDEYVIASAAPTAPPHLRDLCPGHEKIDAIDAFDAYDAWVKTCEEAGWRGWTDRRVKDETVRRAFQDIAERVIVPLALIVNGGNQ